jgi:hypothetical protein
VRVIPLPTGVRIWIATGHTDMRRGMRGPAPQVQGDANAQQSRNLDNPPVIVGGCENALSPMRRMGLAAVYQKPRTSVRHPEQGYLL